MRRGSVSALTIEYEDGVPAHCPPAKAEGIAATLYRICGASPPDAEDYTSHVRSTSLRKVRQAQAALKRDPQDCTPSGLSVYLTEKDIRHACKLFPFAQGAFVYITNVNANEGVLLPTRSAEHYTYWPRASTKLGDRAKLAFGPVDRATVDVG